jgi:hypothetical protein
MPKSVNPLLLAVGGGVTEMADVVLESRLASRTDRLTLFSSVSVHGGDNPEAPCETRFAYSLV